MSSPRLNVLAVDDEQLLLWALERACEGRSFNLKTAITTEEAMAEVERSHYDLFLLDFDLRDKSRLELLKGIDDRCPYVPIIFMTTADKRLKELNDTIRSARKRGAWHLLEKPFSLDRLLGFIETIFQTQGHVNLCLSDISHNFEHEKRVYSRRSHVQPLGLSYHTILDGKQQMTSAKGILTDISDCGVGMLIHSPLVQDQVVSFEEPLAEKRGVVTWSHHIEEQTYRVGFRLC